MLFGIIQYDLNYIPMIDKVCISTRDIIPTPIACYTKQELETLSCSGYEGLRCIYIRALEYFPINQRKEV